MNSLFLRNFIDDTEHSFHIERVVMSTLIFSCFVSTINFRSSEYSSVYSSVYFPAMRVTEGGVFCFICL